MSESIKAMIMSAGIGSRLDPLTRFIPKPLVPIANVPVMDILFENLRNIGISDVICNTYYLANKIIDRYRNNNLGINFNYIIEDTLSGTAGGLGKCRHFFDNEENFLVLSADGLSNADLKKGIEIHKNSGAVATIGIKKISNKEVSHFGVVITDENGFITEFQEKPSVQEAKSNYINTGIYIFNREIFSYIPENTFCDFAKNVFPQLVDKHAINTFAVSEYWNDIGTIEQYKQSIKDLFAGKYYFRHGDIKETSTGAYISGNSEIPYSVQFVGNSVIGNNCIIGENTIIENSIIWDDVKILSDLHIKDGIIVSNCIITTNLTNEVKCSEQTKSELLKI